MRSPFGSGIVGVLGGGKGGHGLRKDSQGVLREPGVLQGPAGRYPLLGVVRQQLIEKIQTGWGGLWQLLQPAYCETRTEQDRFNGWRWSIAPAATARAMLV